MNSMRASSRWRLAAFLTIVCLWVAMLPKIVSLDGHLRGFSFLLIFTTGTILLAYSTWLARREWIKNSLLVITSILVCLSIAEAWLHLKRNDFNAVYREGRLGLEWGTEFGRSLSPNQNVRVRKLIDGEALFDVSYTIGPGGYRSTKDATSKLADTFVFFGGSYTMGHGVEDHETMPEVFSAEMDYSYNVINFSGPGYGPQQMLRALELGALDNAVSGEVRAVVYQAIPHHVYRAAGLVYWTVFDPAYIPKEADRAAYNGPFLPWPLALIVSTGEKSRIVRTVFKSARSFFDEQALEDQYVAVVNEARILSESTWGSPFYLVWWENGKFSNVPERLKKLGVRVINIADILPGELNSHMIERERHPTAEAHLQIGTYIANLMRENL